MDYLQEDRPLLPIDYETLYFDLVNKVRNIHEFIIDCTGISDNGLLIVIDKKMERLDIPN